MPMVRTSKSPTASQKQHVELYRKVLLRKRLLRWAVDGPVYVPFIGDGDLAAELYGDRRVFGADLVPQRIRNAKAQLPLDSVIVEHDCDFWPFPGVKDKFAVADFDAFANPYPAFHAFWDNAQTHKRLVLFFTDGLKQAVIRTTVPRHTRFDGQVEHIDNADTNRKRQIFHSYFAKYLWPYFELHVRPWRVVDRMRYTRGSMLYWGAVIERRA
jgi:hypothetical protein